MKELRVGRYYNANGFSLAIVASITWWDEAKTRGDWAAYIGATSWEVSEEDTAEFVRSRGCKLSKEDALHYFPDIKLPYRK